MIATDLAHAAPYGRTNYVFGLSDPQTGAVQPAATTLSWTA